MCDSMNTCRRFLSSQVNNDDDCVTELPRIPARTRIVDGHTLSYSFARGIKTASEIRDIVNPAVGAGAVIKHKEIIRELSRRGGGSSSG